MRDLFRLVRKVLFTFDVLFSACFKVIDHVYIHGTANAHFMTTPLTTHLVAFLEETPIHGQDT